MITTIKLRRGTAAQWTLANPVLSSGEPGVETDTGLLKVGNGIADWLTLPYHPTDPRVVDLINDIVADLVLEGVPGPAGPTGATGETGSAGTNGTNGLDGESATVTLVPDASWPPAADSNPLHLYVRVP
jgi:hypothetical protein